MIITVIAIILVVCIILAVVWLGFIKNIDDNLQDSDGDGYNDLYDEFPYDPTEWSDADYDGYGDNFDTFPQDITEWIDTDFDGYGDNSDKFPTDNTEWSDYDNDGIGDWSDYTELHFEWQYKPSGELLSRTWTWDPEISHAFYTAYKNYDVTDRYERGKMVTTSDPLIEDVIDVFDRAITNNSYDDYDGPSFVLAFVQSLEYITDNVSTGFDDYSKFPIETLFEMNGDCEDTSILYATIMTGLGYDVSLLSPPGHMAVGIAGEEGIADSYIPHDGKRYYYCETTGEGWKIGDLPEDYLDSQFEIVEITGTQWVPDYSDYYP